MSVTQNSIENLPSIFLQQLVVIGIAEALNLDVCDTSERTNKSNDLALLRVDIYAYLSAWLVCSVNNGMSMSIDMIEMRYKTEGDTPSKKTYQDIIKSIRKIISKGEYKDFAYYPDSDPLSCESLKSVILKYLDKLILLIV
jgi:hypothetical protein